MSKVKVLFFAADPLSAPPDGRHPRVLLDEDVREIRRKVRAAEHRDALDFDLRLAARADDLIQALNETRPQVVHFSGHGNHGGLVLASADGRRAHPVDAAALAGLFEVFRGDIRVVVLNACLSLPQAEAIADVVGCAIGTRGSISDAAAITFGASFYRAIAFGHSVRAAYDQARAALKLEHFGDAECPELVARPDVDPARLVLVSSGGPGLDTRETRKAPRDGGTLEEPGPRPPATPSRTRPARAARWAGMIAVAVASGIMLVDGDPPERGPRGTLGVAADLPATKPSPGETSTPSPADPATASAAAGEPSSSADLGAARDLYEAGNFAAALPLFERAAEAGNAEAMGFLGVMYLNGEGTGRKPSLAILWLRQAANRRDARGMNALGVAYERGEGLNRSTRWAMHWYKAAAEEKGYAPAMSNIAKMYRQGLGVEVSYEEALAWYRRAVEAGSVEAMVDAGMIHGQGLAGAPDKEEALRLYRAAAEAGSARGMVALGLMYQEGDGVSQDYAEARFWYLKGVEAGSADAMNNMGVLYQNGWGVRRSREEAIRWFRRADYAGSTVAEGNLAALGAG